jgi:hypothetical protein
MIDRIFAAALTFCVLAGGTVAIASAMFETRQPAAGVAAAKVVQLPAVEVVGRRAERPTTVAATERAEPGSRNLQ